MSCRCYEITLPDGSKAIVRSAKPGWRPSAADIELIVAARNELLVQRMRARRADVDPDEEGMGGDAVLDRMVP